MKAFLILANGQFWQGESFGATGTRVGEVVFTTGMAGYEETLTDPNFFGQIVVQSYPLVGNYGITEQDGESRGVWASGYVAREVCDAPSNFRCKKTLDTYLKEQGLPGLCGIDTRSLVRTLRSQGVMNGAITTQYASAQEALADPALMQAIRSHTTAGGVAQVGCQAPEAQGPEKGPTLAVLDFGCKRSLVQEFVSRGIQVSLLPPCTTAAQLAALSPAGILLSGGPGEAAEHTALLENLRQIAALGKPVLAVGLGHQLLALAMGGSTQKLPYGHRGQNQPVRLLDKGTVVITGQNHGYAVVANSLPAQVATLLGENANDGTVEAVRYTGFDGVGVQYQPVVSQGFGGDGLLEEFIAKIGTEG